MIVTVKFSDVPVGAKFRMEYHGRPWLHRKTSQNEAQRLTARLNVPVGKPVAVGRETKVQI